MLELILISLLPFSIISSSSLSLSLSIDLFLLPQEEQRQRAKRNREELRVMMEEHEEVHSGIRWRRVCAIFEDHPLWKAVNPEERKDVFEDVTFALAKKERVRIDGGRGGSMQVLVEKDFWTLTHMLTLTGTRAEAEREKLLQLGQDLRIHDQCDLQDNMGSSKQVSLAGQTWTVN